MKYRYSLSLPCAALTGAFVLTSLALAAEKDLSFSEKLLAVDANEGCAIVDVNNDGYDDVYISTLGEKQFYLFVLLTLVSASVIDQL